MADIARRIKLYNQAYQLVSERIAENRALCGRPGVEKELHDIIRRQIAAGSTDVVAIAAAAVRQLQARYGSDTPQST